MQPIDNPNNARPPETKIWHGIVQDRKDPLQAGRIRVRVFGLHTDDAYPTPVENLPWAQILVPTNTSTTFGTPKEGEWVALYFADEGTYKVPVIFGIIPGIVSKKESESTKNAPTGEQVAKAKANLETAKKKLEDMKKSSTSEQLVTSLKEEKLKYGRAFSAALDASNRNDADPNVVKFKKLYEETDKKLQDAEAGVIKNYSDQEIATQESLVNNLQAEYDRLKAKYEERPVNPLGDPRSQAEKDGAPQNPTYSSNRATGTPSLPFISRMTTPKGVRQIKGSIIAEMDKLREHACDWTIPLRKEMSDIRSKIAEWIQLIRAAIDKALAALFGTPFMQTLKKAIAWIKAKIRLIKKIARIIQEKIAYYLDYLRAVLELIEYILTLPAQLLEMFQKCLTQLLGDFGATLKMAVQLVTDPLGYTLKQIGNEFSKIEADPETPEETKLLKDLDSALTAGDKPNPETP